MNENPPKKEDLKPESEKPCREDENADENGAWSEDQKKRSYYYDDACGYEIYEPDEDEREED